MSINLPASSLHKTGAFVSSCWQGWSVFCGSGFRDQIQTQYKSAPSPMAAEGWSLSGFFSHEMSRERVPTCVRRGRGECVCSQWAASARCLQPLCWCRDTMRPCLQRRARGKDQSCDGPCGDCNDWNVTWLQYQLINWLIPLKQNSYSQSCGHKASAGFLWAESGTGPGTCIMLPMCLNLRSSPQLFECLGNLFGKSSDSAWNM